MPSFQVKVRNFEGPLDLLLRCIEEKSMYIGDVSLSAVADDYISYIQARKDLPHDEIVHFLAVAATLMLIKSQTLLPGIVATQEEKASIDNLKDRLIKYEQIRNAAKLVKERLNRAVIYERPHHDDRAGFQYRSIPPSVTIEALRNVFEDVISMFKRRENSYQTTIVKRKIPLSEVISSLMSRVQSRVSCSLKTISNGNDRESLIVSFLALLELAHRGSVIPRQETYFGDIFIDNNICGIPKYGE